MTERTMVVCKNLLVMLETYRSLATSEQGAQAQVTTLCAIEALLACDPTASKTDLEKLL